MSYLTPNYNVEESLDSYFLSLGLDKANDEISKFYTFSKSKKTILEHKLKGDDRILLTEIDDMNALYLYADGKVGKDFISNK